MSKSGGAQFTPGTCQCRWSGAVNFMMCPLHTAAPAMYEALRALVEVFPSVVKMTPYGVPMSISKTHDNAVAALAQAEAQS